MRSRLLLALGALVVAFSSLGASPGGPAFSAASAAPLGPTRAGPVPDYGALDSVWTHPQLMSLAPELAFSLTRLLGERHRVETYVPGPADADMETSDDASGLDPEVPAADALDREDDSLVWMRDYQPIYLRRKDGGITVLRYLHGNPNRSVYLPLWHPTADPFPPAHDGQTGFATLPLLHENGNLVVAGRFVLMTDLIIEDNALDDDRPHLIAAGYRGRSPSEVVSILGRAFDRQPDEIVILPRMPEEQTGHVDLFVMALSDTVVMVPEIRAEALGTGDVAADPDLAEDVRAFLDDVAARLKRRGLEVIRLPMVPPLLLDSVEAGEPPDPVFYSPANGLLLRTDEMSRVLVPTADLRDVAPGLAALQRRYERHWARVFRSRGWTPSRIDASELARYLGLFRCVSQVVPAR